MKSMGHVAYDAFRAECGWLLSWNDLGEDMRRRWCQLAQESATAAEAAPPNGADAPKEGGP